MSRSWIGKLFGLRPAHSRRPRPGVRHRVRANEALPLRLEQLEERTLLSVALDDFTGYAGTLQGKTGGSGWAAAWATAAGSSSAAAVDRSLGAVSLAESAAPFEELALTGANGFESLRPLQAAVTGQAAVYVTALVNVGTAGGLATTFGGVGLYSGTTERFLIGQPFGSSTWGASYGPPPGLPHNSTIPINDSATTLLVAKVDQVHHVLTLWTNPDLLQTEADNTPALTFTYNGPDDFDTVRLRAGGTAVGTTWRFDNFGLDSTTSPFLPSFAADNFSGYAGPLTGNNGGFGWAGPWQDQGAGTAAGTVAGAALEAVSTVRSTAPYEEFRLNKNHLESSRPLAAGLANQSAVYVSALVSVGTSGGLTAGSFGGIGLFQGTTERFLIGQRFNQTNWGIEAANPAGAPPGNNSAVAIQNFTSTLLVARIDQVAHQATLWVNPDLTRTEADNTASATVAYGALADGFDTVRLRAGNDTVQGNVWQFDNLVVYSGTSPFTPFPISGQAAWVEQGPQATTGGQVEGLDAQGNPVAAAIQAIAVSPDPASKVVYVGTVNGGVWKTDNIDRTIKVEPFDRFKPQAPAVTGVALAPSQDPAVVNQAGQGGLAPGVYQYKVVFVDVAGAQSNASLAFPDNGLTLVAPNNKVTLSPLPVGPAGTARRLVYRTTAGGTLFQLAGSVDNNMAGQMFADGKSDANLGAAREIDVAFPLWQPLTDQYPSLAVGALAFDPGDSSNNTLYAGTGSTSSAGMQGGSPIGLLKTIDGGRTWSVEGDQIAGLKVTQVVPLRFAAAATPNRLDSALLVATSDLTQGAQLVRRGGVFRSTDGGLTFTRVSGGGGLPNGTVTDLIAVPAPMPGQPNRRVLFAAVLPSVAADVDKGVWSSDDGGLTWVRATTGANIPDAGGANYAFPDVARIRLTARTPSAANGQSNTVYMAVASNVILNGNPKQQLTRIFKTDDVGATWQFVSNSPTTTDYSPTGPKVSGINPGGQANTNLGLAADPTDPNVLFASGDIQGTPVGNSDYLLDYSGRIFRLNQGAKPDVTALPAPTFQNVGALDPGTYQYRFTYVNAQGVETPASAAYAVTVPAGQNQATLSLPFNAADAGIQSRRVYRSAAAGSVFDDGRFRFVADVPGNVAGGTYADALPDSALRTRSLLRDDASGQVVGVQATGAPSPDPRFVSATSAMVVGGALPAGGRYLYKVTFVNADGTESGATDPVTVVVGAADNGATVLLPAAPAGTVSRKVYRTPNLNGLFEDYQGDFYYVNKLDGSAAGSIMDGLGDALLRNQPPLRDRARPAQPQLAEGSAPAAVTMPGGVLAGTYNYLFTFVSGLGTEGPASPQMTVLVAGANNEVAFSGLPPIPPGALKLVIYRTAANSAGPFYKVTELFDTSAPAPDNTTDAALILLPQYSPPIPILTSAPNATAASANIVGGTLTPGVTYHYRIVQLGAGPVFARGMPSKDFFATVAAGDNAIQLTNLPPGQPGGGGRSLFRTRAGSNEYRFVKYFAPANDADVMFDDTTAENNSASDLMVNILPIPPSDISGTSPHGDSRALAFDGSGRLLEADDGGLYRLSNPDGSPSARQWQSLDGNLALGELYRVAYDPLNNVILAGLQDVGVQEQTGGGAGVWRTLQSADGNTPLAGVAGTAPNQTVYRYNLNNNYGSLARRQFNGQGQNITFGAGTTVSPGQLQGLPLTGLPAADRTLFRLPIPLAINPANPMRLLLGATKLYESLDGGMTVMLPPALDPAASFGAGFEINAVAYATDQPDAAYAASGSYIAVRAAGAAAFGAFFPVVGAGFITRIAVDPGDWHVAYAIDGRHVFATTDAGLNWRDITGSGLDAGALPADGLQALAIAKVGGKADLEIQLHDGSKFQVALFGAVTLADVQTLIQNASRAGGVGAPRVNVTLPPGNSLMLQDTTAGANHFIVTAINGSFAGADLGLLQNVAVNTITGAALRPNALTPGTPLATLNSGAGVALGSSDIRVRLRDNTTFDVRLGGATTLADIQALIEQASKIGANPPRVVVTVEGNHLRLDSGTGATNFTITALNGSLAGMRLGILKDVAAATIVGDPLQPDAVTLSTPLATLNAAAGVRLGSADVQVQLPDGSTFAVLLAGATTLADVQTRIQQASTAAGIVRVTVTFVADHLQLQTTVAGANHFTVSAVGDSPAAGDLGILKDVAAQTITGDALGLNPLTGATTLAALHAGAGVRLGQSDLQVQLPDASTFKVWLVGSLTLADVTARIQTASQLGANPPRVTVAVTGNHLQLTSSVVAGGQRFQVSALNGSLAAADLGILKDVAPGQTIVGDPLRPDDVALTTPLTTLDSGNGVQLGSVDFNVQLRDGSTFAVRLAGATTLADVKADIERASRDVNGNVRVTVTFVGDHLQLDTPVAGTANFQVNLGPTSSAAIDLGIFFTVAGGRIIGNGLGINPLMPATVLGTLNGGAGVRIGGADILVQLRDGSSFPVWLLGAANLTDVATRITNASIMGVARVTVMVVGDHLQLDTTVAGANNFKVTALNSSPAGADLHILKDVAANQITGDPLRPDDVALTTPLATLNDNTGVTFGSSDLRVHLLDGTTFDVSLLGAVNVGDVLTRIQNASLMGPTVRVTGSVSGRSLVLVDSSTLVGANTFQVTAINDSTARAGLGLTTAAVESKKFIIFGPVIATITGTAVTTGALATTTVLTTLNNNAGVQLGGADLRIQLRDNTSFSVRLEGSTTLADVKMKIETASRLGVNPPRVTVTVNGNHLQLDTTVAGGSNFAVSAEGNSPAAARLGLVKSVAGPTIAGDPLKPGNVTGATPLGTLNRGAGVGLGDPDFQVQLRNNSTFVVRLAGATTLADVKTRIEQASRLSPTAVPRVTVTVVGNHLQFVTTVAGANNFKVTALNNSLAAAGLGILQDVAANQINGDPLRPDVLAAAEPLAALNAGTGVRLGGGADLAIQLRDGTNFSVLLAGAITLDDVKTRIEAASRLGDVDRVTVTVDGNHLRLDTAAGPSNFKVTALNGSQAAADLGILMDVAASTIVGGALRPDAVAPATPLATLDRGAGVPLGGSDLHFHLRDNTTFDVRLTGAATLADVQTRIQDASRVGGVGAPRVTVALAGNSLQLTTATGPNNFMVTAAGDSPAAAGLGLLNKSVAADTITGDAVRPNDVTLPTPLASLLDGGGVRVGGNLADVLLVGGVQGLFRTLNPVGDPRAAGNPAVYPLPDPALLSQTVLSSPGPDNDVIISAKLPGPAVNGVTVRIANGTARSVVYNPGAKSLIITVPAGTWAQQVVTLVNTDPVVRATFSAALTALDQGQANAGRGAVNPGASGVLAQAVRQRTWDELAVGLPNAQVVDVLYSPPAKDNAGNPIGDTLVLATRGRGAFEINNASSFLGAPSALTISGGPGDNTFVLKQDGDPLFFDVIVNNQPRGSYELSTVNRIRVVGGAGNDTLQLDNRLAVAGGVDFDGSGGNNTLAILGAGGVQVLQPPTATPNGQLTLQSPGGQTFTVTYANVGTVAPILQTTPLQQFRAGLTGLAAFSAVNNAFDSLNLALLGQSVGEALGGRRVSGPVYALPPSPLGPPSEADGGGSQPQAADDPGNLTGSLFRRILETGTGAFLPSDVGTDISSLEQLRARLDALDNIPGNVILKNGNGSPVLDVTVQKTLSGDAAIDLEALAGLVSIRGNATVSMNVTIHLVMGADDQGFYIDTNPANGPEVVIDHISLSGDVNASGHFGFLGVQVTDGTIQLDPGVRLALTLLDPRSDPLTGEAPGRLRLDELAGFDSDFYKIAVEGSQAPNDLVFTGKLAASAEFPGLSSPFSLGEAQVVASWSDVTNPLSVSITAVPGSGGQILSFFLNLKAEDVINGLADFADFAQEMTGTDLLATRLPVINKSLGEIVNANPMPLDLTAPQVTMVSALTSDTTTARFTVDVDLTDKTLLTEGVKVGNEVRYRTAGGDMLPGTIDAVTPYSFTVRYGAGLDQPPNAANPSFEIVRKSSLGDVIRTSLGNLLDPAYVRAHFPTLQDLVRGVAAQFGIPADEIDQRLQVAFDSGTKVLSITPDFKPDPLVFSTGLDFSAEIPGLQFDASGNFSVTVAPEVRLPLRFDLNFASSASILDRVFLAADPTPEITLGVTANLDNPNAHAQVGLLGLRLSEDPGVTPNTGITLGTQLQVNLVDPAGPGGNGRITLRKLLDFGNILKTFSFTLGGSVNIDGLLLKPEVAGTPLPLGTIAISIDGATKGKITSLADLKALPSRLTVTRHDSFGDFSQLSPGDAVTLLIQIGNALQSIAAKLNVPQGLPFVEDAVSTVVDFTRAVNNFARQLYFNPMIVSKSEMTLPAAGFGPGAAFAVRVEDGSPFYVRLGAVPAHVNATLDGQIADVNAALNAAGLGAVLVAGHVGDLFTLTTTDPTQGIRIDVSTVQATAPHPAPTNGRLSLNTDLTFRVKIGDTTTPVTLKKADLARNTTVAQLVGEINTALVAAGFGAQFLAVFDGTELRIVATSSQIASLVLSGAEMLGFATNEGPDANQAASALGLGTGQAVTADFRFNTIQDFVNELNILLTDKTTGTPFDAHLTYVTSPEKAIEFHFAVKAAFAKTIPLQFDHGLDVGVGTLNFSANANATFQATAGLDLTAGINLTTVGQSDPGFTGSKPLASLNQGTGVRFLGGLTATGAAPADGRVAAPTPLQFEVLTLDTSAAGGHRRTIRVTVKPADVAEAVTPDDLAAVLTAKLTAFFAASSPPSGGGADFSDLKPLVDSTGAVTPPIEVVNVGGKLKLIPHSPNVAQLIIDPASGLGFGAGQVSDEPDITISLRDGSAPFSVLLSGAQTLKDVKDRIETASKLTAGAAARVQVQFDSQNSRLILLDLTKPAGPGTFRVAALSPDDRVSPTAEDLGIQGSVSDSFVLTYTDAAGNTTATSPLPSDSSADEVLAALRGVAGHDAVVTVTGGTGGPYTVTFATALGEVKPLLGSSATGMSVAITTKQAGSRGLDQPNVQDIRIARATTGGSGVALTGDTLNAAPLTDQFFIQSAGSGITAQASVDAPDVNLTAALGLLDLKVKHGSVHLGVSAGLGLQPIADGDGEIRLSDFLNGSVSNLLAPSFTYAGRGQLPIDSSLLSFLPPNTPNITIAFAVNNAARTMLAARAPDAGLSAGLAFTIQLQLRGGGTLDVPVALTQAEVIANPTPAQLATLITSKLLATFQTAPFKAFQIGTAADGTLVPPVAAVVQNGRLALAVRDPQIRDLIVSGTTVLGFDDGQASSLPAINFAPEFGLDVQNFDAFLGGFRSLSLGNIVTALRNLVATLQDGSIKGLNTPIPLLNKTPNDVLNIASGLLKAADEFLNQPDPVILNQLSNQIAQALPMLSAPPDVTATLTQAFDEFRKALDPNNNFRLAVNAAAGPVQQTPTLGADVRADEVLAALRTTLDPQPQTATIDVSGLLNWDAVSKSGTDLPPLPSSLDFSNYVYATQSRMGTAGLGLPDDAFFPATAQHPDLRLSWSNSESPGAGANARFVTGSGASTAFTIMPSVGRYTQLELYGSSTEAPSTLQVTLNYSTGPAQVLGNFVVDNWDRPNLANPDEFTLIGGRNRWTLTTNAVDHTTGANYGIFGYELHPDPTRTLLSVQVQKTSALGRFVFFGASGKNFATTVGSAGLLNWDAVSKSGTDLAPLPSSLDFSNYVYATQSRMGATGKGLPDDAFFPATAQHPDLRLSWSNSELPGAGANARFITASGPATAFTIPLPQGQYNQFEIYGSSTEQPSTLQVTLNYSSGPAQVLSNFQVDDWGRPTSVNPAEFTLIGGLNRWTLTTNAVDRTTGANYAVYGFELQPDPTRTLLSVQVQKVSTQGRFVYFGSSGDDVANDTLRPTSGSAVLSVTGPVGGPFVVTFDPGLGAVPVMEGQSDTGMSVAVTRVRQGAAGVSEVQQISFVPESRLVSIVSALDGAINALPAGSVKNTLVGLDQQVLDQVTNGSNLGIKLGNLTKKELGLPADAFRLRVDFVDADANQAGFQPAVVVHLNVQKELTRSFPLNFELPNYGPITLKTGGTLQFTVGGNLDLDFGVNLSTITPYILDTTRAEVYAAIHSSLNVAVGVAGFDATLNGQLNLTAAVRDRIDATAAAKSAVQLSQAPANTAFVVVSVNDTVLTPGTQYTIDTATSPPTVRFTTAQRGQIEIAYPAVKPAGANLPPARLIVGVGAAPDTSGGTAMGPARERPITDTFRLPDVLAGQDGSSVVLSEALKSGAGVSVTVNGQQLTAGQFAVAPITSGADAGKTKVTFTTKQTGVIQASYVALIADSAALQPSDGNTIGGISFSQLVSAPGSAFFFDVNGIASADLGADLFGTPIHHAVTAVISLNHPTPQLDLTGLTTGIGQLVTFDKIDLHQIIGGARAVLTVLQTGLQADLLQKLPLVGTIADMSGSFIGKLQGFLTRLDMDISTLAGQINQKAVELRDFIWAKLGPGTTANPGLNILDPLRVPNRAALDTHIVADLNHATFKIDLPVAGHDTITANFNLGLAAMPFAISTSGGVTISYDYRFDFGLALDVKNGFYFQVGKNVIYDTSGPNAGFPKAGSAPELSLNASVILNPGTTLAGRLFFLQLTAQANPANPTGTGLGGAIFVDLNSPKDDGKITFDQLVTTPFGQLFNAGIKTTVSADLLLKADLTNPTLPNLSTELTLNWALGYTVRGGLLGGGKPLVQFKDVTLDLGSFLTRIAKPIFDFFDMYVAPLKPVVDFLNADVPGVSDIAQKAGKGRITFLGLGILLSQGRNPNQAAYQKAQEAQRVVALIDQIFTEVNEINNVLRMGGTIMIDFGTFTFGGPNNAVNLTDPNASALAESALDGAGSGGKEVSSLDDAIRQAQAMNSPAARAASDLLAKLGRQPDSQGKNGFGLSFPVFSNPGNIFKMFTGEVADLVKWHVPRLEVNLPFSAKFGPLFAFVPLYATVGVTFNAFLDLSIGFDSRGLAKDNNLLDGFYFANSINPATHTASPVFGFGLEVAAGAELNLYFASVGLEGAIIGRINFDWNDRDHDGKIYLTDIVALLLVPPRPPQSGSYANIAIFKVNGGLTAVLRLTYSAFFISGKYDIISKTFFDFNIGT